MVVMGRVTAPFGVKGWVKVHPLTAQVATLCDYPVWWLGKAGEWREMPVDEAKASGAMVVAQLAGISDRDGAAALRGWEVAVPRDQLPAPREDEYYWTDLIGLRVVNAAGHEFGHIVRMIGTGANDVLVVKGKKETLIPFIAGVIRKVDFTAGQVEVDWGVDY
jgi:16S rRNA processing protein RimM